MKSISICQVANIESLEHLNGAARGLYLPRSSATTAASIGLETSIMDYGYSFELLLLFLINLLLQTHRSSMLI